LRKRRSTGQKFPAQKKKNQKARFPIFLNISSSPGTFCQKDAFLRPEKRKGHQYLTTGLEKKVGPIGRKGEEEIIGLKEKRERKEGRTGEKRERKLPNKRGRLLRQKKSLTEGEKTRSKNKKKKVSLTWFNFLANRPCSFNFQRERIMKWPHHA